MASYSPNEAVRQLRLLQTVLILVACSTLLFSFGPSIRTADLWALLGLSQQQTEGRIKEGLMGGYIPLHGLRNLTGLASADKATLTKQVAAHARQYLESESFKREYQVYREQSKPTAPDPARTKAQISRQNLDELAESIKEAEESMKTVPADLKPVIAGSIATLREYRKQFEDPNNPMLVAMAEGEQQQYTHAMETYKEDLKEWERQYPAQSGHFLRLRLQEFLAATEGIDFNAKLVPGRNGKMIFANPEYESKPSDWKRAFRAGKEVTTTARTFAQKWMGEIK